MIDHYSVPTILGKHIYSENAFPEAASMGGLAVIWHDNASVWQANIRNQT